MARIKPRLLKIPVSKVRAIKRTLRQMPTRQVEKIILPIQRSIQIKRLIDIGLTAEELVKRHGFSQAEVNAAFRKKTK